MGDVTGLEADLRSNGISVERLDGSDPVALAYLTAFPGESVHHGEAGRACLALLERARAGEWTPARVEATVLRATDDVLGTWHAEAAWFEALLAGELSEPAFSARVIDSVTES